MELKARRLVLDIETSPYEIETWQTYEASVLRFKKYAQIISFAWKWVGEKQVYAVALPDFPGYKPGKENDRKLVEFIVSLLDKADVVIYQNGDKFDRRRINSRCYFHNIPPPSFYRTVDTVKNSRRYFDHPSHKLDEKAKYGGFGRKMSTGGYELWTECMAGNMAAWRKMKKYNKHDVVLCEADYLRMLPWIDNHPNMNIYNDTRMACRFCGGNNMVISKHFKTKSTGRQTQYKCKDCLGYSSGPFLKSDVVLR